MNKDDRSTTQRLNDLAFKRIKNRPEARIIYEKQVEELSDKIPEDLLKKCLVRPPVFSFSFGTNQKTENLDYHINLASGSLPDNLQKLITWSCPEDETLLLSVNLSMPLKTIMAEIGDRLKLFVKEQDTRMRLDTREMDFLVWGEYLKAGQTKKRYFRSIAGRLALTPSTVKHAWYRCYEVIYGKPYDPGWIKTVNQKKADQLCKTCLDAHCYKKAQNSEWQPCAPYLALVSVYVRKPNKREREELKMLQTDAIDIESLTPEEILIMKEEILP